MISNNMNYSSFREQPLVYICLFFLSGILFKQLIHFSFISFLGFAIFCLNLILIKKESMFLPSLLLLIFMGGWFYSSEIEDNQNKKLERASFFQDQEIFFKGKIKALQIRNDKIRIKLKQAFLKKDSATLNGGVYIYLPLPFMGQIDDYLLGRGNFLLMDKSRNPGSMDYQKYYSRKNIYGRIFIADSENYSIITESEPGWDYHINAAVIWIKNYFRKMAGTNSGLLISLILGDRSGLDWNVKRNFANSGVIHVLAVSGLHLGYVLLILISIIRIFPIPWGWDKVLILMGLIFYIILSGSRPSVIRAGVMAAVYLVAPLLNRKVKIWNAVALAALGMLIYDPGNIYDLGFLLSISAVASIILLYTRINNLLPENYKIINIQNRFIKYFWSLFLISVSAQLGCLPLLIYYFHYFPIIGLISNIFIVPLGGLLVGTGFMLIILGWIPVIGPLIGNSAAGITNIILSLTQLFSGFTFSVIQVPPSEIVFIPLIVIIIIIFILKISFVKNNIIISILILGNILIWRSGFRSSTMDVIFLDVGQGDAVIIKLQSGKTMLIDAGSKNLNHDYGREVVLPALQYLGIKHINWAVMTHPHNDHIGGFSAVETHMKIDTVWDSYLNYNSWTYKKIIEKFSKSGTVICRISKGDIINLDKYTTLMVLAPDSLFVNRSTKVNNSSLVFKIVHGRTTILFTGDMETEGNIHLLQYGDNLKARILKVAHHGSITSNSQAIIDKIAPDLAFVSVGKSNRFRHPSNIVLKRLTDAGVTIHRSDIKGALWIQSNAEEYWIKEWK